MVSEGAGVLGTLLAALGLYGLLAYSVTRRTQEIGVRMALGATQRQVLTMVLRDAFVLVAAGVAIGIPVALWGRGVAASVVVDLPKGTAPIAAASATMAAVALLAAYLPARRAARVRPIDALREF
jgi:ABC-type antimicrobial peptide transport system permease subunit